MTPSLMLGLVHVFTEGNVTADQQFEGTGYNELFGGMIIGARHQWLGMDCRTDRSTETLKNRHWLSRIGIYSPH